MGEFRLSEGLEEPGSIPCRVEILSRHEIQTGFVDHPAGRSPDILNTKRDCQPFKHDIHVIILPYSSSTL
jgi:hypothetical protein